jgi:hypothetical protein
MMYTVIPASKEQVEAFYEKHMKPFVKTRILRKSVEVPRVVKATMRYSYDSEDGIGFFSISTITGKKISCQVRGNEPMFVELTGFGNIRYDIAYPDRVHEGFYNVLKVLCKEAKDNFWKGGQI